MDMFRHKIWIWRSQHSHNIFEKERDSPIIDVSYGYSNHQMNGVFFFAEKYLSILITEWHGYKVEQYSLNIH